MDKNNFCERILNLKITYEKFKNENDTEKRGVDSIVLHAVLLFQKFDKENPLFKNVLAIKDKILNGTAEDNDYLAFEKIIHAVALFDA